MGCFLRDRNLHHDRVNPDKLQTTLADKRKSSHPIEMITTEQKPVKVLFKFIRVHILMIK